MIQADRVIYSCILLFIFLAFPAGAEEIQNPWTHTFYFENDLFTGTDRNYTNGVKYSLISPDLSPSAADSGGLPRQVLDFIQKWPFIADAPEEVAHKLEFSLGQNMYTPKDIASRELQINDRPYAGWTYFGTAYHRKNSPRGQFSTMDTVEIQAGLVGPESFTEETQKFVHKLRDLQRPEGWDNQLKNEPGLLIAYERKWLFHPHSQGLGYHLLTHAGGAVGNIGGYLNAGVELRLGLNIPQNFGVSLIRPAGSTRMDYQDKPAFYLLCASDSRLVGWDIFLDGNTLAHSHSVPSKALVSDLSAGLAFNYKNLMLTWTQVLRTREFEGQPENHSFGALSISWFFKF